MTLDRRVVYGLLCLACFTISFNVAAITAVIPVISQELKISDFLVAKVITYYLIPYGIGALLYAPLTKKLSYRLIFVVSLSVYVASCLWCGFAPNLSMMLCSRIAMGLAAASVIPLGLMIIGDFFDESVRGRLVGVFFSTAFVASLSGILLSGLIHWRGLFFIPAATGIVTLLGFLLCQSRVLQHTNSHPVNYFKTLRNPSILKVFVFIFVLSFLYHAVHKWYGVFFDRIYGMTSTQVSLFFVISVVSGFLGQLSGGFISDKKGRGFSCWMGLLGLSLMIMCLGTRHSLMMLGWVVAGVSFFWTLGHNGISTILTDFSKEDRPAVASLNSSIRFLAGGLGFYISRSWVEWSFLKAFFGIGILLLLVSLFLKFLIPRQVSSTF